MPMRKTPLLDPLRPIERVRREPADATRSAALEALLRVKERAARQGTMQAPSGLVEEPLWAQAARVGADVLPPVSIPEVVGAVKKAAKGDYAGAGRQAGTELLLAGATAGFGRKLKAAERAARAVAGDAAETGIRAWHGSPYDFDEFDISKIGTGEGAQAEGWGLYFGGAKKTGETYRNQLAPMVMKENGATVPVPRSDMYGRYAPERRALEELEYQMLLGSDIQPATTAEAYERALGQNDMAAETRAVLEQWQRRGLVPERGGRLYEVALGVNPSHMLDKDLPLYEQPEVLERLRSAGLHIPDGSTGETAVERLGAGALPVYRKGSILDAGADGHRLYANTSAAARRGVGGPQALQQLARTTKNADHAASLFLRDAAGVPGLQYLDAMSRPVANPWVVDHINPETGKSINSFAFPTEEEAKKQAAAALKNTSRALPEGTAIEQQIFRRPAPANQSRNFVMFDDDKVSILQKLALAAMTGAGAQSVRRPSDRQPTRRPSP